MPLFSFLGERKYFILGLFGEFYYLYLLILHPAEDLVKPGVGASHAHEHALPGPVVGHQVTVTHQVYGLDAIVATFYPLILIKH